MPDSPNYARSCGGGSSPAVPLAGFLRTVIVALAVIYSNGCSKQELKNALEEAKTQTKSLAESTVEATVEAVQDKLPQRGVLKLDSSPSTLEIGQLSIELINIGDGRPNAIQFATYDTARPGRTFPAILLHGTSTAGTAASLVGQTVACDVYYQTSAEAPISMTKPGSSLAVTFNSLNQEDNTLNATLGPGELLGSDDQVLTIRGGEAVAVIIGEGK
jgi:hypothetical protein